MVEPPVCHVHNTVLRISTSNGKASGLYFYCKYKNTSSDCPEYTMDEWRKKHAVANFGELQKIAEEHGLPPSAVKSAVPAAEDASNRLTRSSSDRGSQRILFPLPKDPNDLISDPRTGLLLVQPPEEHAKVLSSMFNSQSLLHYVGIVEKMNHNRSFEKRFLAISTYCIYLLHLNGNLARCLEVMDVSRVYQSESFALLGLVVPSEFDVVIRSDPQSIHEIIRIMKVIYEFKTKHPFELDSLREEALLEAANVKKPSHWRLELKYVHTKSQLYKRLEQHNQRDASLEYLSLSKDPRTGLELKTVPKSFQPAFKFSEFRQDRESLLHFFSVCEKVNHKLATSKRFCLISNSCVYLYEYVSLTSATSAIHQSVPKLQRCIPVRAVGSAVKEGQILVLKIPSEYDLMLTFSSHDIVDDAIRVITTLYKFKAKGRSLTVEDKVDVPSLLLKKPTKGWKSPFAIVLTRRDLIEHLRAQNIKPSDSPNFSAGDLLDVNDAEAMAPDSQQAATAGELAEPPLENVEQQGQVPPEAFSQDSIGDTGTNPQ